MLVQMSLRAYGIKLDKKFQNVLLYTNPHRSVYGRFCQAPSSQENIEIAPMDVRIANTSILLYLHVLCFHASNRRARNRSLWRNVTIGIAHVFRNFSFISAQNVFIFFLKPNLTSPIFFFLWSPHIFLTTQML